MSVSGIVTDKPGSYSFSVLLDGAQEGVATGHRIVLDIPVTVVQRTDDRRAARGADRMASPAARR